MHSIPRRHGSMRGRQLAVASLLAVLIVGAIAGPAAADFEWGHQGTVGPHKVFDEFSDPSVTCAFRTVSETDYPDDWYIWKGKLERLDVEPPRVKAIRGTQTVGWQFIVQRAKNPTSTWADNWATIYRSQIQTALATRTTPGAFTPMSVPVNVPPGTMDRNHGYRVMVKMIWYRPDGSVRGKAKHLLSSYQQFFKGENQDPTQPWCMGRTAYWMPDETTMGR